jgi:hypothetical protein
MAISNWPVFYWNWHIVERLFPNTCSFWLDGRSKHTPEKLAPGLAMLCCTLQTVSLRCGLQPTAMRGAGRDTR